MAPPDRRYVVHRPLASGGAATVHLGRLFAGGGFSRRVAIKRLHPAVASEPELAAAFAEEARLASRVAHANIAAILDVVAADRELLLVMEYVHGESLSRLLMATRAASVPPPVPIVASVLTDVLHGLHAVHEATGEDGAALRLVHRDVSPQNVIVGTDGSARIVDFGIAKAVTSAHVTVDGTVKGKVPYMAPEQLLRRSIDRRIDIYSAGVMLWEALAGRRLFTANDEPTLFNKVLEEPVPPPSATNPAVPPTLDAIAMRAIDRDPGRRFATARDMAVALEGAVARAPLSTVGDWVSSTASEAIGKRAAMIAEMERETVDVRQGDNEVRAPSASVIFRDGGPRAADSSGSVVAAAVSERGGVPHPRRWAWAIALGVTFAAALVFAIALGGPKERAPAAAETVTGAPTVTEVAPPPTPTLAADPVAPAPPATATVAPATTLAAPAKAAPAVRGALSTRWCKVFDPDKKIFMMKPMRVARCP